MRRARGRILALTIACSGVVLGSCGEGKPASISSQIRQWSNDAGFPDLDGALIADFPAVRAGIDAGNLKALKTACAGLSVDAASIYDTLVTPDHALTEALDRALTGLGNAGNTCTALGSATKRATATLRRQLETNEALYRNARSIVLAAERT